ncbi:hypothetical protein TNCT_406031 [Trichonephila clavata]|uniref:Uncharacterized protein n=1 Tax=Trichonephila clavata TaxID=2740835 RepID=A0A8X6LHG8_TRICU|nr:hypothetical protein TNCT_406031 [Trichonephila clavata]
MVSQRCTLCVCVPILVESLGVWDPENDTFLMLDATKSYINILWKLYVSDCIRWSRYTYTSHLNGVQQYSVGAAVLHLNPFATKESTNAISPIQYNSQARMLGNSPSTTASQVSIPTSDTAFSHGEGALKLSFPPNSALWSPTPELVSFVTKLKFLSTVGLDFSIHPG